MASWRVLRRATPAPAPGHARPIPGEHDRIEIEVINASGVTGLARGATLQLRDGGLDVVYYGNDTATTAIDSTEVLVRRGAAEAGERVRRVLGVGRVRAEPDAARMVDVSVRLGRDFAGLRRDP